MLDYANSYNSIHNVKFTYSTSNVINSGTLSSYDILIMPGGSSGKSYLRNPRINGRDIQRFVASGKGYVGICAGSYAASYRVYGCYYGWGIAPSANCRVGYRGRLSVSMTWEGNSILRYSGIQTIYHWNEPAMYKRGPAATLATYADRKTRYRNYDAIVMDTYGSGRTVLSGSHPELSPAKPEMLACMVMWAAKK